MTSDEQVMGLQLFLNKTENHPRPERPKTKKVWTNITNLQSPRKPEKDAFVATKHQHYHTLSAVRSQDLRAEDASRQTSDEWLNNHGLVALRLTTRDLVAMGNIQSNDETINTDRIRRGDGGSVQHELRRKPPESLEYDLDAVTDFECKLHSAITDYTLRIKWLLQSSRRVFGMIKGENVGLLLDASNTNLGYGRDQPYRNNLIKLVDEQLSAPHMKTLFVATYGTRTSILWPVPMTVNGRVLDELKTFIQKEMQPSGSSNLLDGIKTLLRQGRRMLDCIVIVCGSCPDQAGPHIINYTEQLLAGYETPRLHLVDYDSRNLTVSQFLAQLANIHGTNSFHCYSTGNEATIYTSDDIAKILKEISNAQGLLRIVQELRLETENAKILANEAMQQALESAQASARSPIHHLPQPPDAHFLHGPLILPKLDAENRSLEHLCKPGWSTSKDWLERQGLNARKLGLFQILSTNAYSQVTGYIPSIKRTVSAQIHEQCMVQMRWLDGTIKNVHVDHAQLFEYQKQLTSVVSLLEKRVHWLTKESRGYFGCVVEPHVVIMVDLSKHNAFYLVHIQYCLRHVLEQQISEQSTFNLIAIGTTVRAFRPSRVPVTATNLQAAWNWFRELSCMGTRNILAGLRFALENGVDRAIDNTPQGLYLFTSGIPDQEDHVIMPYLEAKRCQMPNFRLHVALYNVDDYDTVTGKVLPSRYGNITKTADTLRSIANSTEGRFHWFRETGIIESDDIRVLLDEIDCAVEYSQQCRSLVDSVQAKSVRDDDDERSSDYPGSPIRINRMVSTEKTNKGNKSIAPRLNALANSRKLLIQCRIARANNPVPSKALAWSRGVSSTSANSSRGADPMQPVGSVRVRPGSTPAGLKEVKVPNRTGARISFVGRANIPKEEEQLTTRDWLRKYSLRSLGLTLLQLVSSAACRHEIAYVNPIRSHVEARYCTGLFPIVNVAGTLRHLQYTHSELELFKKEVKKALRRYVQRLNWLVSGSRRYFGVIAEQCVVILLDISGSMEPRLNELKYQVKCLVWEQLFKKNIVFNLIAFNSELADWQSTGPTVPDETACHDAVAWVEQLEAYGGTETAEAVCRALHHLNLVDPKTGVCPGTRRPTWITPAPTVNKTQAVSKGIYLFTDGKPDASCKSVLKTIHDAWALNAQMESDAKEKDDKLTANNNATFGGKRSKKNKKRTMNVLDGPLIHTISFTQDETAGNFLRKLARMTGGRYHPALNEATCYSLKQRALSLDTKTESETHSGTRPGIMGSTELPNTGGDDLDGLIREINGTLEIVEKTRYFQHVYSETKSHPRGQSVEEK